MARVWEQALAWWQLTNTNGESVGASVVAAHEDKWRGGSPNRPIAEGVLECVQAVQLSPCGFGLLTSEEVAGLSNDRHIRGYSERTWPPLLPEDGRFDPTSCTSFDSS